MLLVPGMIRANCFPAAISNFSRIVPEAEARSLEQLIAKGKYRTELQFALPAEGTPRVVDLWLDGEPWKSKLTK